MKNDMVIGVCEPSIRHEMSVQHDPICIFLSFN